MTLVSDEETIVIEFSEGQEPHIPKRVNHGIVSDHNALVFCGSDVVKPNLVLSNNIKHLSCWNNCDKEDKHEEGDVTEYLENNINKWRNSIKKCENIDDFDKQKWYDD